MKKLLCIFMVVFVAMTTIHAEEPTEESGSLGLGYQGVLFGNTEYIMNQLSLRLIPDPIGGGLILGHMKRDDRDGGSDSDIWILGGKIHYTLIDRKNSDFYIGGLGEWVYYDYRSGSSKSTENTWVLGVLAGVEWKYTELPEIGFNFEVGYTYSLEDDYERNSSGSRIDDTVYSGTFVSLGATYYF